MDWPPGIVIKPTATRKFRLVTMRTSPRNSILRQRVLADRHRLSARA
jgi:hypothetical protein